MSVILDAGPSPAQSTWLKLKSAQRVQVLDDTLTAQDLVDVVARISGRPAEQRVRDGKSLGEIMVLAHASVLVQRGLAVFVLIDDGDGRRRARREQAWLERAVYDQMRHFDDGLPAVSVAPGIGSAG